MSYVSSDEEMYAKKYRAMKKKLRLLVYERESFIEELKKTQRKVLKVSRDKSFLLDRLLRYEEPRDSSTSSDSDSTESSDGAESSVSATKERKRKLPYSSGVASAAATTSKTSFESPPVAKKRSPAGAAKPSQAKQVKVNNKHRAVAASSSWTGGRNVEQPLVCDSLTRQEVERQLELKRIVRPQFMNIDATPSSLPPDDIFSNDNSNSAADAGDNSLMIKVKDEDDDDMNLVIDMAS